MVESNSGGNDGSIRVRGVAMPPMRPWTVNEASSLRLNHKKFRRCLERNDCEETSAEPLRLK